VGREAKLPRQPEPPAPEVEAWVEAPWWLPTVMPDLAWARELAARKARERERVRETLAFVMMVASSGRFR
jgi:hypothetical protein